MVAFGFVPHDHVCGTFDMMCCFVPSLLYYDVCRPYLARVESVVRCANFCTIGIFPELHTHCQLHYAMSHLHVPVEFGGFNVPSLALGTKPAEYMYASLGANLDSLIIDLEPESLGPLHGTIRQEL
jgi:hypothetical protein